MFLFFGVLGMGLKELEDLRLTSREVIQFLRDGNARFVAGLMRNFDYREQISSVSSLRRPFAVVVSCMDSRIPISLIFDQGVGSIFNICVAGNFVGFDVLSSLELACISDSVKLIVIIGHNDCSAIKSVCDGVAFCNVARIFSALRPAVMAVEGFGLDRTSYNRDFVYAVARKNVELSVGRVCEFSSFLREKIFNGEILVVGAMYDIYTGCVEI